MKFKLNQFLCKSSILAAFALTAASAYSQNFLVAEGDAVRVYGASGTPIGTFASGFSAAIGVAEGGGRIFISDYLASTVTKYSTSGTNLGVMDNTSAAFNVGPTGLAFLNNRVHISNFNVGAVGAIQPDPAAEDGNRDTPSPYAVFTTPLSSVHGMTSGAPNGFSDIVYYTGNAGNGDAYLEFWQPFTAAGSIFNFGQGTIRGVVAAGNNEFYVAMYDLGKVVKLSYDANTQVRTASDFITGLTNPVGVELANGNLYVSTFNGGTGGLVGSIRTYNLSGVFQSSFDTVGSAQYFSITAIPEPSTYGLLIGAGLLLFVLHRRRSKIA